MKTKQYMDENNVVPMKADMTRKSPAIEKLLEELGHKTKAIPYVAIFPSDGSEPVTYAGILTQAKVLELLETASVEGQTSSEQSNSVASQDSNGTAGNELKLATE